MIDYYDKRKKQRQEEELTEAVKEAASSAGIWGGVAGATSQLLGGNRSIPSILMRGLGTGAASAAAGGGATYLGDKLLGAPSEGDPTGYTTRASVGGGLGGAVLGGGLGYLLGSGRLRGLAKIPGALKVGKIAKEIAPPGTFDNMITDHLKKLIMRGDHASGLEGAALLGTLGGLYGGFQGASEGTGIDFIRNIESQKDRPEEEEDPRDFMRYSHAY